MKLKRQKRQILFAALLILTIFALVGCAPSASLGVLEMPKTDYVVGESLDLEGGKLSVRDGNVLYEVAMTDPAVTYTGYDKRLAGEQTVVIAYRYGNAVLTTSFMVTVVENPIEVVGIAIVSYPRNEYVEGQLFDPTGLVVEASFSNGTSRQLAADEYTLTVGDAALTLADNGGIEVKYKGCTASFLLVVEKRVEVRIELFKNPDKTAYLTGDAFDLGGAQFRYLMNDGTYEEVATDLTLAEESESAAYLTFGVTELIYTDGTLCVAVPVTVAKHVSRIAAQTISTLYTRANQNLADASVLRGLHLRMDVRTTKELKIDGTAVTNDQTITIDSEGMMLTVNKISALQTQIDVHLYFLLSLMKKEIVIETAEDIVTVQMSEADDILAQKDGSLLWVGLEEGAIEDHYATLVSQDKSKIWLRLLRCNPSGVYVDLTGITAVDMWINATKVVAENGFQAVRHSGAINLSRQMLQQIS